MKNKLFWMLCLTFAFMLTFGFTSMAAFSEYWYQTNDGVWHVMDQSGDTIKNCWFCDDAAPGNGKDVWYLIDAYGNMATGALVQGPDGKYYSLETQHNGYYGMLRYQSGTYDGIPLVLDGSHNGAFGQILNPEGIAGLTSLYGVKQISVSSDRTVYSSSFAGKPGLIGPLPSGIAEINTMKGTITLGSQVYHIDQDWGLHYLTGYTATTKTASGKYGTPQHTISGPSYMLGKTAYVQTVAGPKKGAYDGIYVFEDTGGPAVEYGKDTTMGVPVVDIFFATYEEAAAVTWAGWTTAQVYILKE